MERGQLWRGCFKGSQFMLDLNGRDLTDELAAKRPAEGVATAAWIVGHLVKTRRGILGLLGAPPAPDPVWDAYGRYAEGDAGSLPFSALVAAFKATDEPLKEALRAVTDWDRPTLNPATKTEQPLESVIAFFFSHEGYHLGQLGLIRKLLGLKGAI
jgi:uncharacterized damage-inducible protein DinB